MIAIIKLKMRLTNERRILKIKRILLRSTTVKTKKTIHIELTIMAPKKMLESAVETDLYFRNVTAKQARVVGNS